STPPAAWRSDPERQLLYRKGSLATPHKWSRKGNERMTVYFVYRTPYETLEGKYLKHFEDDSVLDWFRDRWERLGGTDQDDVVERVDRELGCHVYSFYDVFLINEEGPVPPPRNGRELAEHVESRVYNNNVRGGSPHVLQVDTDDDDFGLA